MLHIHYDFMAEIHISVGSLVVEDNARDDDAVLVLPCPQNLAVQRRLDTAIR